tara:strand:- start:340 stop:762 length:423 start_codon:yes stop_codon:yes gene_type:complete
MATNWPKTGPNHTPAYISSGIPYVTASTANEVPQAPGGTLKFSFPFVTKFFQIENTDASQDLRVGFSDLGVKGTVTNNYMSVAANTKTDVLELRCKELYFGGTGGKASFRIIAGLTTIPASNFPILTGSVDGTGSFGGIG